VDASGANNEVSVGGKAVVEFHFDFFGVLDETDASVIEMKHAVRQRGGEDFEQVGAVKVVIRCAEVLFAKVGQALTGEEAAIVPPMDFNRERAHCDSAKRVGETEPMQDAVGVGANLDAGADLAQLGRLFEKPRPRGPLDEASTPLRVRRFLRR